MPTKASRARAKPTIAQPTFHDEALVRIHNYDACSPQRKLVAWTVGLIAGFGTAFGAGQALAYLVTTALVLTNSSFLALLIYVVGLIVGVYGALQAFSVSFHYITSPRPSEHLALVSEQLQRARSWFQRESHA